MRRRSIVLAVGLGLPLLVRAQAVVVVPRDTTTSGNVVRFGERVDVDGTVTGDAILFGNTINVNGTVEGDLLAAGQSITVRGTVKGSVRAAASVIVLAGPVGRNVTVAAQSVEVTGDASIGGDAAVAAQQLVFGGRAAGSLDAVTQGTVISGQIGRDARVRDAGDARSGRTTTRVAAGAVLEGRLVHKSRAPATVEAGATVRGGVVEEFVAASAWDFSGLKLGWSVVRFASLVLFGLILQRLFSQPARAMLEAMRTRPFITALVGFVVLVATPLAALLIGLTLVGLPISLALLVLYALALYLARALAAVHLGRWLQRFGAQRGLKLPVGDAVALVVGLLTITVVLDGLLGWSFAGSWRALNAVGGLVGLALTVWGVGGFALGFWRTVRPARPTPAA